MVFTSHQSFQCLFCQDAAWEAIFISQSTYIHTYITDRQTDKVCDNKENLKIFSNINVDFEVENIINVKYPYTALINLFVHNILQRRLKSSESHSEASSRMLELS